MSNPQMAFGKRLRELRKSKGLTQEALGEKIKVSSNAIGQFERGTIFPDFTTIANIINALDIDANLFFDQDAVDYPHEAKWIAKIFDELKEEEKRTVGRFFEDMARVFLGSIGDSDEDRDL